MIIKPLKDRLMLSQLGVRDIVATTTPFDVPTVVEEIDGNDGANEGENLPIDDAKLGMKKAEPHDLGVYVISSQRFLRMGANADALLREMIVENQARKLTRWGINGTGVGVQPVGLLNTPGIGTESFSGVSVTAPTMAFYQALTKMEEDIRLADAFDSAQSLSWLIPVKFLRVCRMLHDENAAAGTASMSFARKVMSDSAEDRIIGHAYRTWTGLAASSNSQVVLGDWYKLWHIRWQGLQIVASNVAGEALRRRQTHIAAWSEHDFMVEHPAAFSVSTSLDLSGI